MLNLTHSTYRKLRAVGVLLLLLAVASWAIYSLTSCVAVPILDAAGNPTGKTKLAFSPEHAGGAMVAAAPFLPPPFGPALPILAGLIPLFVNKKGT